MKSDIARPTDPCHRSADPIPRGGADMKYTMQLVLIPGAHASGIDVSCEPSSWQRKRPGVVVLNDFPTVNGTGVSARGRPS